MAEEHYSMHIDLTVLEHLGTRLYTSMPAVISEYVANSWDAMSQKVRVDVPQKPISPDYEISICDDGVGMTPEEIDSKLLTIGRNRREEEGDTIHSNGDRRKAMGRKGIGILSGFSVANQIEVKTTSNGETTVLRLDYNEIAESSAGHGGSTYNPYVNEYSESSKTESGTTITLKELNLEQRPSKYWIRQRLSRQFSLSQRGFRVYLNGDEIDLQDGNLRDRCENIHEIGPEDLTGGGDTVKGWIGTSKTPISGPLEPGISIVSRGRLVDGPRQFRPTGMEDHPEALSHLLGVIHADFLDLTRDLIATDRSSVIWSDSPANNLEEFLTAKTKEVCVSWAEKRREEKLSEVAGIKLRYHNGHTLGELVDGFEMDFVEFKESANHSKSIASEICAMANSEGGVLVIGVSDNRDIVGVSNPDNVQNKISSWVRDLIDPKLSPSVYIDSIEGKDVVVVDVERVEETAASVDGTFWIRTGSSKRGMTFDELKRRFFSNM